eukprot:gnl/Dysnectes_brevis/4752_a6543_765.p1 GENE.gnl/Dysnectes_brevis/4752_a6543_765~~gnl/Dysnectes_brevis/4752_a6543_765.p1  ORF type:complete len:111 (+),score=0.23 gnl/Dysnectes_brevis/4752_a6543_765:146-478(+)
MLYYRLDVFIPSTHLEEVKTALFSAGAGCFGDYDSCCWQTKGAGQFRPLKGSTPFIGVQEEVSHVDEWKVELLVDESHLSKVIDALLASHPYETPAYQYWQVHISHPVER